MLLLAGSGCGLYSLPSLRQPALSVAVLPFVNASADAANKYFSDALTEEVTDDLSRCQGIRMVARSLCAKSIATTRTSEIGRKLHVTTVLEGSVERFGDRVRIVAELERVSDGSRLWSSTYEGRIADILPVPSEVAAGMATSLRAVSPPPRTQR